MAYTRQYPNSITPNGSTVRGCLENDDKELKRVLGLISDVGGLMLSGTKRQCVLYGSTDSSGNPNFLTASGLKVSIDGSSKPVILSFANGFSTTSGTLDTLDAITSAVSSAWTIPANSTYYLFIEKDMSTGLLSYGRTANEDTYSKSSPSSPVLDQCYFNTNEMKMYHYNGSSWEQKWRIFVAKAVSTDSAVTITHYPMESKAFIRDNLESKNIEATNVNAETINNTKVSSLSPHTLKRSIAYVVGDVAYSSNLPSWAHLECTTAGTTASAEPTLSSVTVGASVTDGTVVWIVRTANIFNGTQFDIGFVPTKLAIVQDQKASGTVGGTFTAGAWRTRDLNTITYDDIGVTIANNQITLPIGKYYVEAFAVACAVGGNQARLYNISDNSVIAMGSSSCGHASYRTSNISTVFTHMTVTSPTVIEFQHYGSTTDPTYGFGWPTSTGNPEVYAQVIIRKVE